MIRDTSIWQSLDSLVYKLRMATGWDTVDGQRVPAMENEYSIRVDYQNPTGVKDAQARDHKEFQMAEAIAAELNRSTNPVIKPEVSTHAALPRIEALESLPPNCNPFNHDHYHMGCNLSGAWMAMYDQHYGIKPDYNRELEEKGVLGLYYPDPKYIIMVNVKTGQRFQIVWPEVQSTKGESE